MKKTIILISLLIFTIIWFFWPESIGEYQGGIPSNLNACYLKLDVLLSFKTKYDIKKSSEEDLI